MFYRHKFIFHEVYKCCAYLHWQGVWQCAVCYRVVHPTNEQRRQSQRRWISWQDLYSALRWHYQGCTAHQHGSLKVHSQCYLGITLVVVMEFSLYTPQVYMYRMYICVKFYSDSYQLCIHYSRYSPWQWNLNLCIYKAIFFLREFYQVNFMSELYSNFHNVSENQNNQGDGIISTAMRCLPTYRHNNTGQQSSTSRRHRECEEQGGHSTCLPCQCRSSEIAQFRLVQNC